LETEHVKFMLEDAQNEEKNSALLFVRTVMSLGCVSGRMTKPILEYYRNCCHRDRFFKIVRRKSVLIRMDQYCPVGADGGLVIALRDQPIMPYPLPNDFLLISRMSLPR
jgi:hypothetical protein